MYTMTAEVAAAGAGAAPKELARTDLRCSGVSWGDDDLALVRGMLGF